MNVTEQIGIMKFEARLANRARGEGLRNWTAAARAKSLAVRQAAGSVWGWNTRTRAVPKTYTSEAFDRSMEALNEDAAAIRRNQASSFPTISAPSKYAEQLAEQRLDSFKAWLAEVKRTENAIDDFNGIVAAAGGLMGGVAKAQRGQNIGAVTTDAAAGAAAKKVAFEKSIRRKYEKNNADYLRQNPDERGVMLDMVAEKAEYYSASPAQKVEMEKNAYRRIRDNGSMTMREAPATKPLDYSKALEAKRNYVRERETVRPQLQADEVAYPTGNGLWIAQMPDGSERVIKAVPPQKTPGAANDDLLEAIEEARIGARMGSGLIVNRAHSAACASSRGEECNCSCGGSQHGTQAPTAGSKTGDSGESPKDTEAATEKATQEESPEDSEQWANLVADFKAMIENGDKPTLLNLQNQLAKDRDEKKFELASAALDEAWHTTSLDKFQDKFERNPKNNKELREFQKSIGVPVEFIGEQ